MGGVAKAVGNAFEAVGDVVESAGDAIEDGFDIIEDAGSWVDDNIIQPALDDPIRTAVTVAAVAYGGPAAASYFGTSATVGAAIAAGTTTAATTLASGGDIDDALKSGAVSAAAVGLGGAAGEAVALETGSAAAGNIAKSAVRSATGAGLTGGDVADAFLTGSIVGGVSEAVEGASAAVKQATGLGVTQPASQIKLSDTQAPTTTGLELSPTSTSGFGMTGAQPSSFGIAMPQSAAVSMPSLADYTNYGYEYGLTSGKESNVGVDFSKTGETGIKIGDSDFGIKASEPTPAFDTREPTATSPTAIQTESELERQTKALAKNKILEGIYGDEMGLNLDTQGFEYRPGALERVDTGDGLEGTLNVNLKSVTPDNFELRRFQNPQGKSMMISFRNNKPLSPIPEGFKEVEVVGRAEGGLIEGQETLDRRKTTMVKYAGLAAPKKKNKKKIAGKGLASKKS